MRSRISLRSISLLACLLGTASPIRSQSLPPCGVPGDIRVESQAPFTEIWVDPTVTTTGVGSKSFPFKTIQEAIFFFAVNPATLTNPGLIHLGEGIYSGATNGEFFPISLQPFVSLQGVGARRCIIRNDQTPDVDCSDGGCDPLIFVPPMPSGFGCTGTSTMRARIILDASGLIGESSGFFESLDGVTLQGGDIQIHAIVESFPIDFVVSNCVFDMLNYAGVPSLGEGGGVTGPDCGVLMGHVKDGGTFKDIKLALINNTFVQGWKAKNSGGTVVNVSAVSWAVGVIDFSIAGANDPVLGVGNPLIANNLFRALTIRPRTATLGIDPSDTTTGPPTNLVESNIFLNSAPALANTFACSGTTGGALPSSAFTGLDTDPAFVGEYLMHGDLSGFSASRGADWRVLPDSIVKGLGVAPDSSGFLDAANLTRYVEPSCGDIRLNPIDVFDFDGEGYGNPRIEGVVDVGVDEVGDFIMAGYQNDAGSKHRALFIPTQHVLIAQGHLPPPPPPWVQPLPFEYLKRRFAAPAPPVMVYAALPGSAVPPTPSGPGLLWIATTFGSLPTPPQTLILYVPTDGTSNSQQSFRRRLDNTQPSNPLQLVHEQSRENNKFSNLQSAYEAVP